jgi:hypothetical protein
MTENEQHVQELENEFASLSGSAFYAAFRRTLDSGLSVYESEGGFIYEIFPDGSRKKIKPIDSPTPVERGKKILIP